MGVFWQPLTGWHVSVVQPSPSSQLSGVPAVQMPAWQVSSPLQTSASAHGVPLSTGVLAQPKTGSQPSVVQALPSSQSSAVPAVHTPPWQVSSPLQTSPSAHGVPFATGVFVQPVSGSQVSVVQTLLSSQLSGAPAVQTPAWQVSSPLQRSPSVHGVPFATGVLEHPKMGSQLSVVQTLPSSQSSGVPAVQAPAWQVSSPLQTSPSAHGVPLSTGVLAQPATGSQLSLVQPLPSLQLSGVPAVQVPARQVSSPLQTSASAHEDPSGTGTF
jgi:hypothetical protein